MEQADTSYRVNAAGSSLEGEDAIGRPFGSAATADEFGEYGGQAAAVSSRVGEYVRVHTTAAVCNGMNIPVKGNHDVSWLGSITGASAATSEEQGVYEVLLHGPKRVVDIPVKGAGGRLSGAQIHLQWIDFAKDDPHVNYAKWEGCTLGGVKYNETAEAEASWGEDAVDVEASYLAAGQVSMPAGGDPANDVGLTGKSTSSPTKSWSSAVEAAKPANDSAEFEIGAEAEYSKVRQLEADRLAAMEAVKAEKTKMAGKGVVMKPRRLDLDGSAGGVQRSGGADLTDLTSVGCLPAADLSMGMGKASASTRIARKNSVSQAPIEGLNASGDSRQSRTAQETEVRDASASVSGDEAPELNQCTNNVPRSELRERISGNNLQSTRSESGSDSTMSLQSVPRISLNPLSEVRKAQEQLKVSEIQKVTRKLRSVLEPADLTDVVLEARAVATGQAGSGQPQVESPVAEPVGQQQPARVDTSVEQRAPFPQASWAGGTHQSSSTSFESAGTAGDGSVVTFSSAQSGPDDPAGTDSSQVADEQERVRLELLRLESRRRIVDTELAVERSADARARAHLEDRLSQEAGVRAGLEAKLDGLAKLVQELGQYQQQAEQQMESRISREAAERLAEQQHRDGICEQRLEAVMATNATGGSGGLPGGEVPCTSCTRVPVVDPVRLLCQICVDVQATHRPSACCTRPVEGNSRLCLSCIQQLRCGQPLQQQAQHQQPSQHQQWPQSSQAGPVTQQQQQQQQQQQPVFDATAFANALAATMAPQLHIQQQAYD